MNQKIGYIVFLTGLSIAKPAIAESLWNAETNNELSMFADRTAAKVGDILTVVVSENTTMNKNVNKATGSNTVMDYGIANLIFSGSGLGKHNGTFPGVSINPNDSFSGNGSISDSSSVSSSLTVLVVDTLPNGNLVIEGAKQVDMEGEIQYAIVRGVVRRDDVLANNTIDSTRIASAQVKFLSKGDLKEARKKGWLNKFWDKVNIF